MRSRCHILSLLSLATASIYLGQVFLLALHFLSVDHGLVTRDGVMGHRSGASRPEVHDSHCAHEDAHAAQTLTPDDTSNHAGECLFLSTLLRSVIGIERPDDPGLVCKGLCVLRADGDPLRSAATALPLVRAPKHSPPAAT